MSREAQSPARWAVILAGGEGSRPRELTRQIVGCPTLKQFCPVIGEASLLEQTHRVASFDPMASVAVLPRSLRR